MTYTLKWNLSDADETEVEVEYTYSFGAPATGPTYACGGTPADPDDCEIVACRCYADWTGPTGDEVALLDSEYAAIEEHIYENPPEDDAYWYDDRGED